LINPSILKVSLEIYLAINIGTAQKQVELAMLDNLFELQVNIDIRKLLREANDLTDFYNFIDPLHKNSVNGWKIKHIKHGYGFELSAFIADKFKLGVCKPRFYRQEAGITIPYHTDRGTLCSFNFLLSENLDAISFKEGDVVYKNALLNTQAMHAVISPKSERILYKISVFEKSYDFVKNTLIEQGYSNNVLSFKV